MPKQFLSGNEAIVEGALKAGVKFLASYPITPASEIMHYIVKKPEVSFVQAEDEIASINMVIGASLAGLKSITSTSGPGFSLKQEGIGLAYKLRIPMVIVNVQRVGPSTGMPTMGAQSDLIQTQYGSHGDYVNIVLYPNSVEECYKYMIEAVNAAEESLSPVILLTDGIISQMYETADFENVKFKLKERDLKQFGTDNRHITGLSSKGGVPATRDYENYRKWYKIRKNEVLEAAENYNFYEFFGKKDSDTLLIAFGITSRVILPLKDKYAIFRPIRMFPVIEELKEISKDYKKIVVIEMNDGQYKHELEAFLKRDMHSISQLGGKISLKEIKDELAKIR